MMKHTYTCDMLYTPALYDLRFALQQMSPNRRTSAVNTSPDHRPAGNIQVQSDKQRKGILEGPKYILIRFILLITQVTSGK